MSGNRIIDLDFGPDGALYVGELRRSSNFTIYNANNSASGGSPTSAAPDTPGPDPQVRRRTRTRLRPRSRSTSASPAASRTSGSFCRRRHGHRRERHATRTSAAGNGVKPTATLTVTYADGQTSSEDDRRRRSRRRCRPRSPLDGAEDARPDARRAGQRSAAFVPGVASTSTPRQHHGERHLDDARTPLLSRRRPERHRTPGFLVNSGTLAGARRPAGAGDERGQLRTPRSPTSRATQLTPAHLGRADQQRRGHAAASSSRSRPTNRSRRGSTRRR